MIRRIAVLTSGDDVPGMNAAIRAVTRAASEQNWEVVGVCDGYTGLICGEFIPLTVRNVGGIIQRGGTVLGSIDSDEFLTEAGKLSALSCLAKHNIDALVVIGGDGSQAGAYALSQMGFRVNGVAASIENDLAGSDMTLGVDTALNIALDSIDQLKVMAASDCYAFIVEVAGQTSGYLALIAGIAGGAEASVIPEVETTPAQIEDVIRVSYDRGKSHAIIVVAEGATWNADRLVNHFSGDGPLGRGIHKTTLSLIQHGGAPSAFDRLLGSRLAACAVEALARGEYGVLAGSYHGDMRTLPLAEVVGRTSKLDLSLLQLADVLCL